MSDRNFLSDPFLSRVGTSAFILKSVSKLSRHFVIFVNIFRNFNAISDFSFAMNSYGYENIFQPKKISNPLILLSKNEDEKFPVFRWDSF